MVAPGGAGAGCLIVKALSLLSLSSRDGAEAGSLPTMFLLARIFSGGSAARLYSLTIPSGALLTCPSV